MPIAATGMTDIGRTDRGMTDTGRCKVSSLWCIGLSPIEVFRVKVCKLHRNQKLAVASYMPARAVCHARGLEQYVSYASGPYLKKSSSLPVVWQASVAPG